MLAEVPLFAGLSRKDLDVIARRTDEVLVVAGEELVTQGEPGNAFYVITAGEAAVMKGGRRVATLGRGGFFGEMSLLDGLPRSATVRMDKDGAVLEIHRREFGALLEESPALARKLLVGLSRRLRAADEKLIS